MSVGAAIGEGFRLIRARPGSVIVWGVVRAGYACLLLLLMAPLYIERIREVMARARGEVVQPDVASMMAMQATNLLTSLLGLMVGSIVACAVFRAVIYPEEKRFAYLRLGPAEVFFFLLIFGITVAFVISAIVCIIPIAILIGLLALAHAKAVAFLLMLAVILVLMGLLIFIYCRLSVAGPMMVADGKFHLLDAWALTRGKAGDLFLIGFGVFLLVILIEVVLGAIALAIGLAVVGANLASLSTLFAKPPAEIMAATAPVLVIVFLVAIPVTGCLSAILGAPWARAWRDLAGPAPVVTAPV